MEYFPDVQAEHQRRRDTMRSYLTFCERPQALLALDRDENSLRLIFEGLGLHYIDCLTTNRLDAWARAAHAAVDLLADPLNKVTKRSEFSISDEMRQRRGD